MLVKKTREKYYFYTYTVYTRLLFRIQFRSKIVHGTETIGHKKRTRKSHYWIIPFVILKDSILLEKNSDENFWSSTSSLKVNCTSYSLFFQHGRV